MSQIGSLHCGERPKRREVLRKSNCPLRRAHGISRRHCLEMLLPSPKNR